MPYTVKDTRRGYVYVTINYRDAARMAHEYAMRAGLDVQLHHIEHSLNRRGFWHDGHGKGITVTFSRWRTP